MFTQHVVKPAALGVLGSFMVLSGTVLAGVLAPTASADGCGAGWAPFTSWNVCDYGWAPDGSHIHCDAVFVFGIGGSNCYPVYPPPPP